MAAWNNQDVLVYIFLNLDENCRLSFGRYQAFAVREKTPLGRGVGAAPSAPSPRVRRLSHGPDFTACRERPFRETNSIRGRLGAPCNPIHCPLSREDSLNEIAVACYNPNIYRR
jgi:hypothetical protein